MSCCPSAPQTEQGWGGWTLTDLDLQSLLHQRAFLAFSPDGLGIHGLIYQAELPQAEVLVHPDPQSVLPAAT